MPTTTQASFTMDDAIYAWRRMCLSTTTRSGLVSRKRLAAVRDAHGRTLAAQRVVADALGGPKGPKLRAPLLAALRALVYSMPGHPTMQAPCPPVEVRENCRRLRESLPASRSALDEDLLWELYALYASASCGVAALADPGERVAELERYVSGLEHIAGALVGAPSWWCQRQSPWPLLARGPTRFRPDFGPREAVRAGPGPARSVHPSAARPGCPRCPLYGLVRH